MMPVRDSSCTALAPGARTGVELIAPVAALEGAAAAVAAARGCPALKKQDGAGGSGQGAGHGHGGGAWPEAARAGKGAAAASQCGLALSAGVAARAFVFQVTLLASSMHAERRSLRRILGQAEVLDMSHATCVGAPLCSGRAWGHAWGIITRLCPSAMHA